MTRLYLPTINDEPRDFDILFRLWEKVRRDFFDVTFDFSQCSFLRQNAVAFLGGLARLIEHHGGHVHFAWDTLDPVVQTNLNRQGFSAAFGQRSRLWPGNSIPFHETTFFDKDQVTNYLQNDWLGRGWVNLSSGLRDGIAGKALEIYLNAFEHGQSPIGVFSCGQHYPNLHTLKLTVVDFGVGIPSNVRDFKRMDVSAERALRWAFQLGATTKPNGTGRGLGLDLLKEFVIINKGRLEIFSHEGYALIENNQEQFLNRRTFFNGTIVNITIQCDESYYLLASEAIEGPLF